MLTWWQINMFFVFDYGSFYVKVTWQIFSIPNVKTTVDFPKGTVFPKLREISLAGQERHNAAATHNPLKDHRKQHAQGPHNSTWNSLRQWA